MRHQLALFSALQISMTLADLTVFGFADLYYDGTGQQATASYSGYSLV